jgi:hypothetical protein
MQTEQNDQKVLALFAKLSEKKKEIAKAEKPKWETNCSIGYSDKLGEKMNIQVISDLKDIVELHAFLTLREEAWQSSCITLHIDLPFKWQGYTVQEWTNDFVTRIAQIQISQKKKELEKLEKILNGLVSLEQRREMELAELEKALS